MAGAGVVGPLSWGSGLSWAPCGWALGITSGAPGTGAWPWAVGLRVGALSRRARWAGVKCGRGRPVRKGNCPRPAAAPSGQDGTEPTHHSWTWLPGLRRELGSYPASEGLDAAGPPDTQLRGHLWWVRRRLGCGHSAWPHSGLTRAALLQGAACGRGFPGRSPGEGPEGCPSPGGLPAPLVRSSSMASPQGGAQELRGRFFKPRGRRVPIRALPAPGGGHKAGLR